MARHTKLFLLSRAVLTKDIIFILSNISPMSTKRNLDTMTQDKWNALSPAEKEVLRDNRDLTKQLIGLEGKCVEVVTTYGEKRRFNVGKSTGWIPCHLELHNKSSRSGFAAEREYKSVRIVR